MSSGDGTRPEGLSPAKRALLQRMLQGQAAGAVDAAAISRRAGDGPCPLSFAQQRLWFLHQIAPLSPAYNVASALRLRGPLDRRALARALDEILRRHESLRTRFEVREGAPVQVIDPPRIAALLAVESAVVPADQRDEAAGRLASDEAAEPFDLVAGPLLRARLVRLGEDDHVFLLTMHHIVSDGWSMGVLVGEVAALYEAFTTDAASPLPEPQLQYPDFAAWQRKTLAGDRLAGELLWWKRQLTPLPPALELPADRARPPMQTFRGGGEHIVVAPAVADALRGLAREQGATFFMALVAAFDALLARLTGEVDIAIGTATASRTRPELEPLIGFFVNTLVLRVDCAGDPSFRELVGRARDATLGAFAHQDLPFERVVEAVQPHRDLGANPIFQVLFELQSGRGGGIQLPGLSLDSIATEAHAARFDLEVQLWEETGGGVEGFLFYSTDLFDRPTVRRMADRWLALLACAAQDPEARLSQLRIDANGERATAPDAWNATASAYPRESSIAEVFAEVARGRVREPAVVFEGGLLTYGELLRQSLQVGTALRARGIGRASRVGLALDRSPGFVTAALGVLFAGGAYVPVDPDSPRARTARMLCDAQVALVIGGDGDDRDDAAAGGAPFVALATLQAEGAQVDADVVLREDADPSRADRLAYVMFTSGSTGTPKGIEVTQRNVVRLVRGQEYARFGPDETMLQLAPVAFDASTFEIWGALLNGGRLAIAPKGALSPAEIATCLQRFGATTVWLTAGLFHAVVDQQLEALARVPQVLAGGDVLSPSHVRRLLDAGCARVVNGYGPTETTTFACCEVLEAGRPFGERVPIGRPIGNARVYVLDAGMHPVAVGARGELFIGGDGVARGYAGRADLTAERFVPDPFGPAGSRLYRTGDLVRWRADGRLEFLGRRDGQVKVRGFRVETAEVEGALHEVAGVRAAVVVAWRDGGEAELVAYVVREGASAPDEAALRSALLAQLPRPMVPSRYVFLEALPLTSNGKVDRRALPAPGARTRGQSELIAPRTAAEREVARVWAEVLQLDEVGVTDDFFELGGHSLLATQVTSRLRASLGVEIPLRAVFEAPTVQALAAIVQATGAVGTAAPIPRASRQGPIPLSFAQQRLWFLHRLEPQMAAYNIPCSLRLGGALDVPALQHALAEIVRRHEGLRTRFVEGPAGPEQVVDEPWEPHLAIEELAGLQDPEGRARRLVAEEVLQPFDLERGPLVRARLMRLGPLDHVFVFTMHHIVSDGWSMGVLVREVAALYEAFTRGLPSPLPRLPIQYPDFAMWQRTSLAQKQLAQQLDYWRANLTPLPPPLELPTDRVRPAVQSFRAGLAPLVIPPAIATACGTWRQRGAHAVHGAARGVRTPCCPGRRGRRTLPSARLSPTARGGAGGADRLLRQHAGAAGGLRGGAHVR